MALTAPRLIFVVIFALNCVLWSSSRYGEIPRASFLHGGNSLVKRISEELANPNAPTWDAVEKQCRPLAFPATEQCAHVQKHCPLPKTFLSIPYLPNYYCTEPELRPLIFTGLIIWLVFLFSTLGISASDFFTPNLATIAQMLGLDENVAGVTFLAFGNGSPDVFSTFSAMRADSGSLAIGELLGAASFIVSCVVGSMCIIKPFQLHRAIYFIRDVGFMFAAVSLLLGILWDGQIQFWEAAIMIALYVLYVVIVVVGTWLERRQERRRAHEAMVRSEYDDSDLSPSSPLLERYSDHPNSLPASPGTSRTQTPNLIAVPSPVRARAISAPGAPPRLFTDFSRDMAPRSHSRTPSPSPGFTPGHGHMPSFSLVGALEFRQVVASLQHEAAGTSLSIFDGPYTPYAGGHYSSLRSRSRTLSREVDPWDATLGLQLGERSHPRLVITPSMTDEPDLLLDGSTADGRRVPSISRTPASPTASEGDTESQNFQPLTRRQRFMHAVERVYHRLFPSLYSFQSKTVLGQIASVFAAPAVMLLTLTLPVVVTPYHSAHHSHEKPPGEEGNLIDFEEEGIERILIAEEEVEEELHGMTYSKWLTAAQCTLGPLFCATVLFGANKHYQLWALISAGIVGFAASVLVALFGNNGENPSFRMARCSIGFIVAIVWIMAIADEVVKVLQTFGFIFGLSDAIIGLTIFAVGNSLADLVANMSVAVFAPIMGFSACFGGPMLNILLGVGISGTYITHQTQQSYFLPLSTTLLVSAIGLLILLGPHSSWYL
ncbi:Sodium/calcium exchanger protein-domain-containing protein [Mycena galopus ATCC 62051]|nr:Sodium/calcium exchanger protein-domain-containing protein [Mycena galopus ATCC 62051]